MQSTRIKLFAKGFCHNPKFISHWKFVLVAPLHVSNKQQIISSPQGWMALMTKNLQTEKCLSTISLTKEVLSSLDMLRN